MFDVSISEILLIGVVSCSILGVKDTVKVIKKIKSVAFEVKFLIEEYLNSIDKEVKKESDQNEELVNMIVDLNGDLQESYDISKIIPEIRKDK